MSRVENRVSSVGNRVSRVGNRVSIVGNREEGDTQGSGMWVGEQCYKTWYW